MDRGRRRKLPADYVPATHGEYYKPGAEISDKAGLEELRRRGEKYGRKKDKAGLKENQLPFREETRKATGRTSPHRYTVMPLPPTCPHAFPLSDLHTLFDYYICVSQFFNFVDIHFDIASV